jgi:outer membrane protein assembly factor BamB
MGDIDTPQTGSRLTRGDFNSPHDAHVISFRLRRSPDSLPGQVASESPVARCLLLANEFTETHMLTHRITVLATVVFAATLATGSTVLADNWPGWRGPNSNGIAAEGNYPTTWSATKNVAWKVDLNGRGASTPIVWEDNIFLTLGRDSKNILLCLGRDGKQKWEAEIGSEVAGKHKKASGSNPSCVTDGKHVYAYFKSGDLAAVSMTGQVVWQLNVQKLYGEDTLWWDLGTSPVLTQDNVIVTVMQTGPSFLAAFNKGSGDVAWKVDRNLGAPEEAAQAYSTPIVAVVDGQERIYVLGADHATGHSAATGKELWRVGGLNPTQHKYFRSISGPVLADDVLIAPYARGGSVTGIKLGGSGDVTKSHVLWTVEGVGADVPTPTYLDNRVFVCRDKGTVVALDRRTGETVGEVEVEKNRNNFSASPVRAGNLLYLTRENGTTFVVDVADGLKVVSTNELGDGEFTVATPVLVDGQILLRTYDHLYCIGG